DDPAEDVSPELVGPQPVSPAGGLERLRHVEPDGIIRRKQGGGDSDEDDHEEHSATHGGTGVAAKATERVAPQPTLGGADRVDSLAGTHSKRILGSTRAYERSTRRFIPM